MKEHELLKLAANCITDLNEENKELQDTLNKKKIVGQIAEKLIKAGTIATIDQYVSKIKELEKKSALELEVFDMNIDTYLSSQNTEFGKLAGLGSGSATPVYMNAEEAFSAILLEK